jgi:hypothetical protein
MADDPMFAEDELDVFTLGTQDDYKTRDTQRGQIRLNTKFGEVRFTQRWRYHFTTQHGAAPWTPDEERAYHFLLKQMIWMRWNSRRPVPIRATDDDTTRSIAKLLNEGNGIVFRVSGKSDFARKFAAEYIPIEFDVLISVKRPHWHMRVRKLDPSKLAGGKHPTQVFRDNVDFDSRSINLSYENREPFQACSEGRGSQCQDDFLTFPHEFGHSLGYGTDEYAAGAAKHADVKSIMNIGHELRQRHLEWVRSQINLINPHTTFPAVRLGSDVQPVP